MYRTITNKLIKWSNKSDRMPLMLYGARQIGKTHSLLEFAEKEFKNYIYINFEKEKDAQNFFAGNLEPKKIIAEISLKKEISIDSKTDLIIFDEIQECPNAITSLKYFCENLNELRVIAAGSLLGVKLGEVSYPVGKVEILHMQPMSFEEFLYANDHKQLIKIWQNLNLKEGEISATAHDLFWELFKSYLIVGGMPKAVNTFFKHKNDLNQAYEQVTKVQESILETYYADIGKHCGKENSMHIRRIFENIPEQLSREQSESSSRFKFQGIIPKKKQYKELIGSIDWLEAAGLIHKIYLAHTAATPLIAYKKENFFKLFIFDVGLLRTLSSIDPIQILNYDFGSYKGYLVENFVLQEFIYQTAGRERFFSWQENTAEIEFLCDIDGKLVPIEVKSGSRTKAKSLASYINKYDPEYGIILSGANTEIKPKVRKYPLYLASKIL